MALNLPLRTRAPAKLNLCLHVGARRADGLHELCSVFQPVTLADELVLEAAQEGQDEVISPGFEGTNLAAAALESFRDRFGWRGPPVRLVIDKRVPIAAGLGGGSADAGAALRLALVASGLRPSREELLELALRLGADVPSQLEPATRLVRGAGERLEPLASPLELPLLLLTGEGALGTGAVYARADELGLAKRRDLDRVAETVRRSFSDPPRPAEIARLLHNDLEPAALELEPAAAEALELLHSAGALGAQVSGSGPAAFGVFSSRDAAERARAALQQRWRGAATIVGVAGGDYAAVGSAAPA